MLKKKYSELGPPLTQVEFSKAIDGQDLRKLSGSKLADLCSRGAAVVGSWWGVRGGGEAMQKRLVMVMNEARRRLGSNCNPIERLGKLPRQQDVCHRARSVTPSLLNPTDLVELAGHGGAVIDVNWGQTEFAQGLQGRFVPVFRELRDRLKRVSA